MELKHVLAVGLDQGISTLNRTNNGIETKLNLLLGLI